MSHTVLKGAFKIMLTPCARDLFSGLGRTSRLVALGLLIPLALGISACADVKSKNSYPVPEDTADAQKHGKIGDMADNGDSVFTLFDSSTRRGNAGAALGVNPYLWRASLDTINFMPIASADSNGGTILTDWYSPPSTPKERMKLNVLIKDQTLRADGVQITVFRQKQDKRGNWVDTQVNPATGTQLEDTIIQRARQLRLQNEGRTAE